MPLDGIARVRHGLPVRVFQTLRPSLAWEATQHPSGENAQAVTSPACRRPARCRGPRPQEPRALHDAQQAAVAASSTFTVPCGEPINRRRLSGEKERHEMPNQLACLSATIRPSWRP